MDKSNNIMSVVFAHDEVGAKILKFLLKSYSADIKRVVIKPNDSKNEDVIKVLDSFNYKKENIIYYNSDIHEKLESINRSLNIDFFFLLWWPTIITSRLLNIPNHAVINTHPSLLPFCRGKDPNFWSLVENAPFGVSIHEVTPNIDDGAIIVQKEIHKNWEDNGETLYRKSKKEMIRLFIESYSLIRTKKYIAEPQDLDKVSFHLRNELKHASEIDLSKQYTGRELINLLRARTFPPYPGCWFRDKEKKYEIRVLINELENTEDE